VANAHHTSEFAPIERDRGEECKRLHGRVPQRGQLRHPSAAFRIQEEYAKQNIEFVEVNKITLPATADCLCAVDRCDILSGYFRFKKEGYCGH
jgi:hypothetical protein